MWPRWLPRKDCPHLLVRDTASFARGGDQLATAYPTWCSRGLLLPGPRLVSCSQRQAVMVRFRRPVVSLFGRELSLSGRGARRAAPLVSGRVVSCAQPNGVSTGQAYHSSVGEKYSSKVTTRPVVTPGYTVTTRFQGAQSDGNRRSGAMLTTRIGGLCPQSGNRTYVRYIA